MRFVIRPRGAGHELSHARASGFFSQKKKNADVSGRRHRFRRRHACPHRRTDRHLYTDATSYLSICIFFSPSSVSRDERCEASRGSSANGLWQARDEPSTRKDPLVSVHFARVTSFPGRIVNISVGTYINIYTFILRCIEESSFDKDT